MSIEQLESRLRQLIALEVKNTRKEIAGFIVGELIGDYENKYKGLEGQYPTVRRIADLASDLEWSNGSQGELDAMWQEMCELIRNIK